MNAEQRKNHANECNALRNNKGHRSSPTSIEASCDHARSVANSDTAGLSHRVPCVVSQLARREHPRVRCLGRYLCGEQTTRRVEQPLPLLLRRLTVPFNGTSHEILQTSNINIFVFSEVNGSPDFSVKTCVEEATWVRQ